MMQENIEELVAEEVSARDVEAVGEDLVITVGDPYGDEQAEDLAEPEVRDLDCEPLSVSERIALIEALLFAHGELVAVGRLKEVSGFEESEIRDALDTLQMKYQHEESGIELVRIGQKFQFRTKALYGRYIRALNDSRPKKLSKAALETLAIVAYRQPLVKSDIDKIRGVDAAPVLKTLLDKQLIKIVGHQATVGQPALYGTTDEFLNLFGMSAISELPTLREVKEFESEPGETGQSKEKDQGSPQLELDFDADEHSESEAAAGQTVLVEPEPLRESIEVLAEPKHKLPADVFSLDDQEMELVGEEVANV